jgi:RHH-type proline utilization regulon transcriptional repressor/proline dehydrogenase/delta 1-pyrroline-5-carboxylate dehydrogenase
MIAMLEGAMRELCVGDPQRLAVDVGPVIDADAREGLLAHVERMRAAGLRVVEMTLPAECARGRSSRRRSSISAGFPVLCT